MDEIRLDQKYELKKLAVDLDEKISSSDKNTKPSSTDSEEDVVGPLCTSMKKMETSISENSLPDDLMEPNYEQQLKTPREVNTFTKNGSDQAVRGISFKKSLIFDTGLTPHDDESSTTMSSKLNENEMNERPKAKTSLTFNDATISVKSFYGKAKSPEKPSTDTVNFNINKVSSHAFAAAITKSRQISKPKPKKNGLVKRSKAPGLWRFSGMMKSHKSLKRRAPLKKSKHSNKNLSNVSFASNNSKHDLSYPDASENAVSSVSSIEQNLRLQKILKDQTNTLNASREINWTSAASKANTSTNSGRAAFLDSDDEESDENENSLLQTNDVAKQNDDVENEEPATNRKFFKSKSNNSAKKYRIMGKLSATLKRGGDLKFEPPKKRKKQKPKGKLYSKRFIFGFSFNFIYENHLFTGEEVVVLHNEITSIIDRLCSPSKKDKCDTVEIEVEVKESEPNLFAAKDIVAIASAEPLKVLEETERVEEIDISKATVENSFEVVPSTTDESIYCLDVNKYRQMVPYNTTDPEKSSQQENILELLISHGICNDETFQIFIAEPDMHKDKASQILDSLYCVNTMIPDEYEHENVMSPDLFNANEMEACPTVITPTHDINAACEMSMETQATIANTTSSNFPFIS